MCTKKQKYTIFLSQFFLSPTAVCTDLETRFQMVPEFFKCKDFFQVTNMVVACVKNIFVRTKNNFLKWQFDMTYFGSTYILLFIFTCPVYL